LCKLDFNFRFRFGRVLKPLNDVPVIMKGDNGWVQLFIALPSFWSHEYKLENKKNTLSFQRKTMISYIKELRKLGETETSISMLL
jgi:hypothetical protein